MIAKPKPTTFVFNSNGVCTTTTVYTSNKYVLTLLKNARTSDELSIIISVSNINSRTDFNPIIINS